MKYNKEIIDWFNNYYDNCYYVKHEDYPESIFMFYDINYVRQKKLAKLEGKNIEKTDITGICVFEQEWKYNWFRCDYNLIWGYLRDNYSFSYGDFQSFITDRLEEHSKMKVLTPEFAFQFASYVLEEHSKMKVLTPFFDTSLKKLTLEEHSKMKVLTPMAKLWAMPVMLEEHSKMKVLTPRFDLVMFQTVLEEHSKMKVLTPEIEFNTLPPNFISDCTKLE